MLLAECVQFRSDLIGVSGRTLNGDAELGAEGLVQDIERDPRQDSGGLRLGGGGSRRGLGFLSRSRRGCRSRLFGESRQDVPEVRGRERLLLGNPLLREFEDRRVFVEQVLRGLIDCGDLVVPDLLPVFLEQLADLLLGDPHGLGHNRIARDANASSADTELIFGCVSIHIGLGQHTLFGLFGQVVANVLVVGLVEGRSLAGVRLYDHIVHTIVNNYFGSLRSFFRCAAVWYGSNSYLISSTSNSTPSSLISATTVGLTVLTISGS